MTEWQDHYFVLGLDRNASQDEIKEAYRFKAFTLHPDRLIGVPESKKHRAEEELKKINAAYEILKDPQKRNQYNLELDKKTQSNAKTKPNQPPVLTKLECDDPSPQVSGSTIIWTAHASDPSGEAVYYRFWLKRVSNKRAKWELVRNWDLDNTWAWKTTFEENKDHGIFHVKVEIKNKFHAEPDYYDDQSLSEYILFTPIEKKFYDSALKRKLELFPQFEVKTSSRKYYRLDFAKSVEIRGEPELKVDIECDGHDYHDPEKDAKRDRDLELDGWEVIRFRGSEINNNSEGCVDQTLHKIELWSRGVNRSRIDQPPIIKYLYFNLSSPQLPGSSIECIARVGTAMAADAIFYRFWLKGPSTGDVWNNMTGWIKDNSWNWKTTSYDIGNSQVKVEIRDGHHANDNEYDAQLVENYKILKPNYPPVLISLKPDTSNHQFFRSTIVWTAQATDPDGDPIVYRFWLKGPTTGGVWRSMTNWTSDNIWTWRPKASDAGNNTIKVEVRDGKHAGSFGYDDQREESYIIRRWSLIYNTESLVKVAAAMLLIFILIWFAPGLFLGNKQPEISGLTSNPFSPKVVGSTIDWTTSALDPEKYLLHYRYFLNGKAQTAWSTSKTWAWDTTGFAPGIYKIEVWIRDEKHAGVDKSDDNKTEEFTLVAPPLPLNGKPVIDSLTSDMSSPQSVGSTIDWSASALDPEGDRIYYKFWLKGPATNSDWQMVRDWSTSRTWDWETSRSDLGDNQVAVQVKDDSNTNPENRLEEKIASFTLVKQPESVISSKPEISTTQNTAQSTGNEVSNNQATIDKSTLNPSTPTTGLTHIGSDQTAGNSASEPTVARATPEETSKKIIGDIVSKFSH